MSAILVIFISLLTLIYYLVQRRFNFWKKRKVPFVEPSFIFGNYKDHILLKRFLPFVTQEICEKFPDAPYVGTFFGTDPALVVKDPELIRIVTTKDFYYFSSREVSDHTHHEVMTQNLFFTHGDRWKILRQNFSPLFSSSKMKNMFYLIKNCATGLEAFIDENIQKCPNMEVTDLMARYTIDGISSCAFGVDAKTLDTDGETNPFKTISEQILEVSTVRALKFNSRCMWPKIFYGLGLKVFHLHVNEFFHKILTGVFESRQYKPTAKNDFVDLILNMKVNYNNVITGDSLSNLKTGDNKKIDLVLDDEILVAQCVVFFVGGYETSAFTLSFTLYELAKHQEAQNRAIAEVDDYWQRHENGLDYDCVNDLPYVAACVDEALRLYPVLGTITREVIEDYTLPTGLHLEKGARVHIPVRYLHYHPDYFPEPEKYRPERFLGEERKNVKSYTYMPFGEGQRICIGKRFAKMQMMAALVTILKKYRLELAEDTPQTVELEPRSILPHPVGGIRLKFVQRT
ncbi:cytochrome P450 6B2-like [Epargyreus clarus]|uniref:cytochrome P450 6B2-like n=1 Tax=Epargyreus clarus TaxID=520877 RepID=UPI003C2B6C5C